MTIPFASRCSILFGSWVLRAALSSLFLISAVKAQTGPQPVILFTDLVSGPSTGNSDNSQPGQVAGQNGAIVTVWGKYLGTASGTITVGGAPARVYFWGNATSPADLYTRHGMQMVSFQIPNAVPAGPTTIQAHVNGTATNTLPFTVQPGNIYYVSTNGNDTTGDGSWGRPWATLSSAVNHMWPGDILYATDGVSQTTPNGDRATMNLESYAMPLAQLAGPQNPKAMVAYPNARVSIGNSLYQGAYSTWVGGGVEFSHYWTISKISLTAQNVAAPYSVGFRLVGNRITAPEGDGATGAIAGGSSTNLYVLGNELTQIGAYGTSKLYHPMYIQSAESSTPPHLPVENNREIGWNYLHDNYAYDGINIYREGAYSAYMMNTRIHDNYIVNQTGRGMLLGSYIVGPDNYIYNNVIINAGQGPASTYVTDPAYGYVCVNVSAGWYDYPGVTTIHFYNNTLYGCGFRDTATGISGGMIEYGNAQPFVLDFRNNIVQSTGFPYVSPGSAVLPQNSATHNLWYGQGGAPLFDGAPIVGDPTLVNPASGDAHLQPGSAAIGAGVASQPAAAIDFDNLVRPVVPAVGAFEYSAGGTVLIPSSQILTTGSGLAYSRVTQTFNGTVTIRNISSSPIQGPFEIAFTGLPAGVTLANSAGTIAGAPYLNITAASLAPGASASVSVRFVNPRYIQITFTPVIYSVR